VSTILKALRRLERDKAPPAESPTLREAVTAGGGESAPGSDQPVWLVPGIALLLGIGVGAGFLLLWPRAEVEAAAGTTEVALASPAVVPAEVAPPPVAPAPRVRELASPDRQGALPSELQDDAAEAGLPAAAFASPVQVVARPARQPRIPAPEPEPEPALIAQRAPPVPESEPLAIEQAEAAAEPDPWLVEPVAPAPPEVSPLEVPATSLPDPELPSVPVVQERRRTLPLEEPPAGAPEQEARPKPRVAGAPPSGPSLVEAPAPTPPAPEPVAPPAPPPAAEVPRSATPDSWGLRVERTWWHPLESRREALVVLGEEEVRVAEGQLVGDATVKQIEPSAVVFTRGETEFRRVVGESASE
jgi:hypothetical protein